MKTNLDANDPHFFVNRIKEKDDQRLDQMKITKEEAERKRVAAKARPRCNISLNAFCKK